MTSDMGKIFKNVLTSLNVRLDARHHTQYQFSLLLLTTYISLDSYNSTIARSLPHNIRHTLPSFTADKLRSAQLNNPR